MDTVPDTLRDRPEAPKTSSGRRWKRLAIVSLCIFGALSLGAYVAYRPLVTRQIHAEARARGVELEFADFSLEEGMLVLRDVHARLDGVEHVDVTAREIDITLERFEPTRIEASAVSIVLADPLDERLSALSTWAAAHAKGLDLPVSAGITLRASEAKAPWLTLNGHATTSGGARAWGFDGKATLFSTYLGDIAVSRANGGPIMVSVGSADPEKALVRGEIDVQAAPYRATMTLPKRRMDELARTRMLRVPNSLLDATVWGTATVTYDPADPSRTIHGTSSITLKGWSPPHPRELDGIAFGNMTKLGATFDATPDLAEARISKATVETGAFKLAGPGTVTRSGADARIKLDLKGSVPCAELGASAVGAHVQGLVGDILKGVARFGLGGVVGVRVQVDADTKALDRAKVEQSVDVGCGLR